MALKRLTSADLAANKSRSFRDIGMAFGRNPFTNDVSIVKNDNSIRQSLRNLVMTSPGEIPFNKNVGCQVNAMLFEPLDGFTADTIKDEIINTINHRVYYILLFSSEAFFSYTISFLPFHYVRVC